MVLRTLINISNQLGITPNTWMLCYLIYTYQNAVGLDERTKRSKLLSTACKGLNKADVSRAIDRGWLHKPDNINKVRDFTVTSKFRQEIFPKSAFEDFWRVYPYSIDKENGGTFLLKAVNADECRDDYYEKLLANKVSHENAIRAIQWAKKHKPALLIMRIDSFIKAYGWEGIEEQMKKFKPKAPIQNYKADYGE